MQVNDTASRFDTGPSHAEAPAHRCQTVLGADLKFHLSSKNEVDSLVLDFRLRWNEMVEGISFVRCAIFLMKGKWSFVTVCLFRC